MIVAAGGDVGDQVGHEAYWHTGLGVHALVIVPDLDLVLVHRMDTRRTFTDPGEELYLLFDTVVAAAS